MVCFVRIYLGMRYVAATHYGFFLQDEGMYSLPINTEVCLTNDYIALFEEEGDHPQGKQIQRSPSLETEEGSPRKGPQQQENQMRWRWRRGLTILSK